ncbi:MAG: hypothetical protein AAB393_16315, partial [Bacteroidota bacterium]
PAAIPEGYSLLLSAAYPPYERTTDLTCGNISVGLAGLCQATFSHEGAIGSPIGVLRPSNLVGLRIQVIPQRSHFPAVSVFLTTMTGTQSEFLADNDLKPNLPQIFQRGLVATSYEAKTTLAGLALASTLNDMFSFNVALGARQMVWQQRWSIYTFNTGLPRTQNGWTFPLAERSNLRLDMSASVSCRPIEQVALIGEIASLPFVDIDESSLLIEARQGYVGAIGIRYYLPIPLSIDLYDRWYSQKGDRTNYHQVRLGVSTEIHFQ